MNGRRRGARRAGTPPARGRRQRAHRRRAAGGGERLARVRRREGADRCLASTSARARSARSSGRTAPARRSMLNVINGVYHPQQGTITFKGKRPPRHAAAPGRRAGHRAHVPERGAVQGHERARQHHDRAQPEDAARPGPGRRCAWGPAQREEIAPPRGGRAHHRLPGDPAHPQDAGGPAALWPAEARRAGARAGDGAARCCCSTSRWPA